MNVHAEAYALDRMAMRRAKPFLDRVNDTSTRSAVFQVLYDKTHRTMSAVRVFNRCAGLVLDNDVNSATPFIDVFSAHRPRPQSIDEVAVVFPPQEITFLQNIGVPRPIVAAHPKKSGRSSDDGVPMGACTLIDHDTLRTLTIGGGGGGDTAERVHFVWVALVDDATGHLIALEGAPRDTVVGGADDQEHKAVDTVGAIQQDEQQRQRGATHAALCRFVRSALKNPS